MRTPVDWPTTDLLGHRARATPGETALVDARTGDERTYADLDDDVGALAGRLAGAGVEPGDHLGVLMETRVAFVRLIHAAMRAGAVLVPLNVRLAEDDLRAQVDRADVDALVCAADTEAAAAAAADGPVLTVDEPARDGVEPLGAVDRASVDRPAWDRDDVRLLLFTSGTTGDPKAVALTAGNLVASATASAFRLGVVPGDRWCCPLPMYHMGGLAPVVRSALYGTAVVAGEGFDADATARVVREFGVTGISLVPTMLVRLLDAGWSPPASLRFVLLGGAPASRALVERCDDRGVPVHPTYGMTETASQVATARPAEAFAHPDTVGRPLVFAEVAVVDDDGDPVPTGEAGEVVVDGPTVSPGYYRDEAATHEAFGPRGFHTGDLGYRDEGARLWIAGRIDDRIVTGGENVDPGTVAAVIRDFPGVRDAAVVGIDDPEWGERVAALVAADDAVDVDAIRERCRDRLADYERPKAIRIVDALPRTPSGTVDREAVRRQLRE